MKPHTHSHPLILHEYTLNCDLSLQLCAAETRERREKINDTLIAHLFLFIVYSFYFISFILIKLLPVVDHRNE